MSEMNDYFFTFMQKQAFKDHYVQITAPSECHARECMYAHFSDQWAFLYHDNKDTYKMIRDHSLKSLLHITAFNYESSIHYVLEED